MSTTVGVIYYYPSPWITSDISILRKQYNVIPLELGNFSTFNRIISILKNTMKTDLIYVWFAGNHSFYARILSKIKNSKTILAIGGGEVTKIPSIGYGGLQSFPWRFYVKESIKHSDIVIVPSEFTKRETLRNIRVDYSRIFILYHGFNWKVFVPNPCMKEDVVLTVAFIDKTTVWRKGLIHYVRAAKLLPKVKFFIVGKVLDNSTLYWLRSLSPPNVTFTGFIPKKELIKFYQRSKVYVQASLHEGFGCAVAEAMLCGCVPVVTRRGALPEVVGDTGFYVPYGNPKALAKAISYALEHSDSGGKARKRIMKLFPIEKRTQKLLKIFKQAFEVS